MRPVRAIVYGVGSMGALLTPMLLQKDVQIVGAIARSPAKVGRDLGEVVGLGRHLGVSVEDDPSAVLASAGADIAIVSVGSMIEPMYEHLAVCLEHGVNVITIEEESLYPWLTSPSLARELDELAKRHDVTITGSGIQDVYWVKLVSAVAGSMLELAEVAGEAQWNIDDFGAEVAREFHIGRMREELEQASTAFEWYSPTVLNTLHALVSELGLTAEAADIGVTPITADSDVWCAALGEVVLTGRVIGLVDEVRLRTREGPTFEFRMTARVYARSSEVDTSDWLIRGLPADVRLTNAGYSTRTLTCGIITNRIPDVLNAEPGFVTIDRLPPARYRPLPLSHYVRW